MERTRKLEEANKELADANRKVVEASKAQLRHFACMSHEVCPHCHVLIQKGSTYL